MTARPTLTTLLCALAVLSGVAGAWLLGERQEDRPPARGVRWSLVDSHDNPRLLDPGVDGLALGPGDRLRLAGSGPGTPSLRGLALTARRDGEQSSQLELRFADGRPDGCVLTLVPGTPAEVFVTARSTQGATVELARASVATGTAAPFRLSVSLADGLVASLDGAEVLRAPDARVPDDAGAQLWADGLVLHALSVVRDAGTVPDVGNETPIDFVALARDAGGSRASEALALALAGLALACALVLALTGAARRAVSGAQLVTATLRLTAPPMLVVLLAALRPADPAATTLLGVLALVLGMALSLPSLLRHAEAAHDQPALPPLLLTAALVVACGLVFADAGQSAIAPVLERVAASLGGLDGDDWVLPEPVSLRRGEAHVVPGRRYGLVLEADVTLERRSLLELRLRGAERLAAGMAFVLSTHPDVPSGFVIERDTDFGLAGRPESAVASGRRKHLRIVANGSRFAAFVDGQRFSSAYLLDAPAGALTLLAPTGEVTVHELSVQPIVDGVPLPDVAGYALRAALKPLLMVILGAVLAQHLLRRRLVDLLALVSLALVPAAVAVTVAEPGGTLGQITWLLALAATLPLAWLPLLTAPADIGRGRLATFAVLALALSLGMVTAPLGPPARAGRADGPALEDFAGPRLVPGLVHWQHPLVRRFNTWLREQRFRGRQVTTPKPDDVLRVVAVGSSSTWGHGLPEGSGLAWPARLEAQLGQAFPGRRVEVVNGAVRGSTTGRMLSVLEEVLLELQPDLVIACFGYNDAGSITIADERALLRSFTAPDYEHGLLERLALQQQREQGERLLARLWAHHERMGRLTQNAWERVAPEGAESPRDRYARNINELVRLSEQAGAGVLLVPEPVAGDGRRLWRVAFRGVMESAAELGSASCVDPAPLLAERGGEALFMDEVHLRPAGHAVVAEALAPTVAELLRGR